MASISKNQQNCDRISNLPNNLITHILSFLSTEDAVKTSVLSTSWKQQWTLVPLIRFDDQINLKRWRYSPSFANLSEIETQPWPRCHSPSFVNFVDRVLLYNVTPLILFQLTYGFYEANNISKWISVVVSRYVRQMDVRATMPTHCCLPDSLYSCITLVVLKLKGNFEFQVPEKISLVSLKIFHHGANNSKVYELFSRLVPSCPVLEELQIIGKFQIIGGLSESVKEVNISSLVLKRLILNYQRSISENEHAYNLVLNTPNLQYLILRIFSEHNNEYGVPNGYHLNTLHCLDTARISLNLSHCPERPLAELVQPISNVRVLYLLNDSLEVLYYTARPNFELPKFVRLIYLELDVIESDVGLRMLIAFLQSSPQLESLSFYLDPWEKTWYPPTDVPFCMIDNLKVIKVGYCDEEEPLLNVLTYFLGKTNRLQELKILDSVGKDKKFIKKVSMLPRASNSCEIVLT